MVGSGNGKNNKHDKCKLNETLQAVLEFDNEGDYSDLFKPSLKYQSKNCNQLQLVLFLALYNRNSLMIYDASNACLLFTPC